MKRMAEKKFQKWFAFLLVSLFLICGNFAYASLMAEKTIQVKISKQDTVFNVKEVGLVNSSITYYKDYQELKGVHNGNVISSDGVVLGNFPAPQMRIVICADYFEGEKASGVCQEADNGEINLDIPYFKNGIAAGIFDPSGNKILTIDLKSVAECGWGGKCENKITPQKPSPITTPPLIDPYSQPDPKSQLESSGSPWFFILVTLIFLTVVSLGFFYWKKKTKNEE